LAFEIAFHLVVIPDHVEVKRGWLGRAVFDEYEAKIQATPALVKAAA
jgi:hypothetical protein